MGSREKEEPDSPQWCPAKVLRGNVHKLKYRKFDLNVTNKEFAVKVIKHWHRLRREVVASPSLGIFKT